MTELQAVAESVIGRAGDGEQVEAYVSWSRETSIRAYESKVEQLSFSESAGVGIRVVQGERAGFAYVASLDPDMVEKTLQEARDNASFATADPFVGLAEPDGVAPPDLDLWRESVSATPTSDKVDLALAVEAATRAADRRVVSVPAADYDDVEYEVALASTTGISAATRRTGCWLSVQAAAGHEGETQTGYGVETGRSMEQLSAERVAAEAADRAVRLLGAKKAPSARMAVVFDPKVTGTLIALLGSALSGEAVEKGRSLFAGRIGEQVASEVLTLIDDPTDPAAPAASRFDAEGLACRRNVFISGGRLERFAYDTYSARRAGVASTASAVRAGFRSGPAVGMRSMSLLAGQSSAEEVIRGVDLGMLVQSVSGIHSGVNPVSGDFSVGAEGLMIRDGQLAEPVREVTIASTLQRMLSQVTAVGADLCWLPSGHAGATIAVSEMSLSGR